MGAPWRKFTLANEEDMSNSLTTVRSSAHGSVLVAYLFAAIASLAYGTIPAHAAEYDVGSIHISQPWSRATPKGAKAGAGYMTITNKGTRLKKSVAFQMTPARNARFTA